MTLARAGANVIVNYHRSQAGAEAAVREIRVLGVEALAIRADVSRPNDVRAMFRTIEKRFHRLDVLVNNAAVFFPRTWDKLSDKDWDQILGVNLKGTFFCAQSAARMMQRQSSGRIINISSLGGLQAWPDYLHYCASKAAVIMLTRALAKALAPTIRVNCIAPGAILVGDEKPSAMLDRVIRSTPLKTAGRPEDIASMVIFLASQADFITGQVLPVDGGKSIP